MRAKNSARSRKGKLVATTTCSAVTPPPVVSTRQGAPSRTPRACVSSKILPPACSTAPARPKVAVDGELLDELRDAREAGLVRLAVRSRPLFAEARRQSLVGQPVQRAQLGRRVAR